MLCLADMFPSVSRGNIECVFKELGFSGAVDKLLGVPDVVSTFVTAVPIIIITV